MADLLKRNSAVDVNGNMVNGQTVDIAITEDGSDVYFAFCAIMGFVGLGVLAASLAKPRTHRIFFYITAAVNITNFLVLTLVVWALYPIAWGLGEGGNVIAPDSEAVFYGVLDFLAKPVFSIALVVGHWKIDPTRMGLVLRDYDSEPNYFGTYTPGHAAYGEKPANGTNGQVVDGTADGSGAPVINAPV
ncbi:Putative archaeal/bacterial/fungal rhodopsin [Septoria linicola]|uniref:Archaeal/bacterial/fungal rhodopsin n=1 Tax=Septoria linicola TaxID=215465 RepID=A0A9Q9AKL7_9PEZI|nr:Putative archaeal/bacterial/fungal rhodopsin [Septoria linicola]